MAMLDAGDPAGSADSARRLRALLEAMQEVVLVIDPDKRFVEIAPTRQDLLYRPPPEVLGRSIREVFPPDKAACFEEAVERTLRTREVATIEYSLPIAGREMWFEACLSPMLDARGDPAAVVIVARDVSGRRLAEEQSARRARYLGCLADIAQELLRAPDLAAVLPKVLASLGQAAEANRVYVFENHEDAQGVLRTSQRAEWCAEGAEPQIDNPVLQDFDLVGGGFGRWVDALGRNLVIVGPIAGFPSSERPVLEAQGIRSILVLPLFVEGSWHGFVGFDVCRVERTWERAEIDLLAAAAHDLAQAIARRRALDALRESEERFRRFAEAAWEAIALHDQGRILDVNTAFGRVFGCRPEEAIGRHVLEFAAPESRDLILDKIRSGSEEPYEACGLRSDGTRLFGELQSRAVPFRGRTVRVTALRDVTERRRLEERLRQAQKMEAVGQLAGGMAHDFNNLLTAIGGHAGFLREGLGPEEPLRVEVEAILKAADRASSLVRQLLAFSRRQVMELRVVSLPCVLENLERMLQRVVGEAVDLRVAHAADLGNVRVDVAQMEQVIVNLAVNAREAMPRGGRLTVETSNADLDDPAAQRLGDVPPGRYVLLAVDDTGTGMPPEVLQRLFEPFFTTKEGGTGLGLSTVYGIVRQFGGHIRVESEVGRGTTFRIYLPRTEARAEPATLPPPAEEWPRGTETILVVEDNDMVRNLAVRVLRRQGYDVVGAPDARAAEGLARERRGRIDLLLTDVVMPGTSGKALAERLRETRPDLRVLYMSGYADDVITQHGVLGPGTAFIQKPFTPQDLARKVRSVLDLPLGPAPLSPQPP